MFGTWTRTLTPSTTCSKALNAILKSDQLSLSPLLQLLVGAGGLSALVNMISFSALMCNEGPGGDSLKKLTVAAKVRQIHTLEWL